jgi:hypothetical protein
MAIVIFYNTAHIGDTYFSQKIVETICKQNPQYEFKYFALYNHYIFKENKTIKNCIIDELYYNVQLEPGNIPDLLINNEKYIDAKNFFLSKKEVPYFFESNIIGINIWAGALPNAMDCNLVSLYTSMQQLLEIIYSDTNIYLQCHVNNFSELIPYIPEVNINKFINWHSTQSYKYIVLYYNYLGMSGQPTPLNSDFDHINILHSLSKLRSDIMYIVPSMTKFFEKYIIDNNIKNIISCEHIFDCKITPTCENIYKLVKIGDMCNLVIYYDTGACFTNFNLDILNPLYNKNRVHIGVNKNYYNSFKYYLALNNINIEDKIIFIQCSNIKDTSDQLCNLINVFD